MKMYVFSQGTRSIREQLLCKSRPFRLSRKWDLTKVAIPTLISDGMIHHQKISSPVCDYGDLAYRFWRPARFHRKDANYMDHCS